MKKFIRAFAFLFFILIAGILVIVCTGSDLPQGSDKVVKEILNSDPAELVTGATGFATSGNVNIWYESMGDSDNPPVLLIMGLGASAMVWPNSFYQPLIDAGYSVIRYDNRGLGMSSWEEDWSNKKPYSLEDMALDGLAVLDDLNIEKAHIIGVSMGGMIAQRLAIDHEDRLLSMTSIMSSGHAFDPDLPGVTPQYALGIFRLFLKYKIYDSDYNAVCFGLGLNQLLLGDGDYSLDVEKVAKTVLYERHCRNGDNPNSFLQHTKAVSISGSRLKELENIKVPTLIVHGTSDPLVHPEHAKKYAPLIPGAEMIWVDGMGHDFPRPFQNQLVCTILNHINKTEGKLISNNSY